jgi:Poly(A) polymerase catalytic subunit
MTRYKAKYTAKYKSPEECSTQMSFNECELAILRHAVDTNEKVKGQRIATSDSMQKMIEILEDFLIKKKCICYGGTAINNILPKQDQFYDREYEVPDYDFFSPNALKDAKELADRYYKAGYLDVEAKSGVHHGTYKVFVNFIPMADITYIHPELFAALSKEAIRMAGILYAPPNYLRMSMYLELSRPEGDTSRWEKVLKRLNLLNKHYPLKVDTECHTIDFQREMGENADVSTQIYFIVRNTFIEQGVVFFGGYASAIYSQYMPSFAKQFVEKIPDFDVLVDNPEKTAMIVCEQLEYNGFRKVKTIHHAAIGEVVPEHIEIKYGKDTLAFIYKPIACHNYNTVTIEHRDVNIATIDTILSFYLAFLYAKAPLYSDEYLNRILCTAKFLFTLEQKTRLNQSGILKRFVPKCIGKQDTLENIRALKTAKFAELRDKRNTREYEEWFLKYTPGNKQKAKTKTRKRRNTQKAIIRPLILF